MQPVSLNYKVGRQGKGYRLNSILLPNKGNYANSDHSNNDVEVAEHHLIYSRTSQHYLVKDHNADQK